MALLAIVPLTVLGLASSASAAAGGGTQTYSEQETLPVPPASNFPGANGGGDGWAVALSSTAVYNVFHHQSVLDVACHTQADAQACWPDVYKTITDADGNNFASTAQPGLYLDQATGRLYVYATRTSDNTAGIVCVDTTQAASVADPFCGFTALAPAGDASLDSDISNISNGLVVGSKFYAFNFYSGAGVAGGKNKMLCFDLTSFSACPSEPYSVDLGNGTVNVPSFPAPSVANIGGKFVIPLNNTAGSGQELACFDTATNTSCTGTWPVALAFAFDDEGNGVNDYGAPFPLLDNTGKLTGFCLPTGVEQCYDLSGGSVATPAGLASAIGANLGWNGPALVLGPRIYVPNGNSDQVTCFDYSTGSGCANFPLQLQNLELLYTVNPDPQRPSCIWVNADGGGDQIQNFDAFSGTGCGAGPLRVLASSIVPPSPVCVPLSYSTLQVISPTPDKYTSGSVQFEDSDGFPITGAQAENLDGTGTVSLAGLNLNQNGLPQFLITFTGLTQPLGSVTVQLNWTGSTDPACAVGPPAITTISPNPAPPATNVTISGSALGSDTGGVTLTPSAGQPGAIPAPVVSWGPTSVTATIPAGTALGDYKVTVTTSTGAHSNALPLTVGQTPPPGGGAGGVTPLVFTADTPPSPTPVGAAYSYTFVASGVPQPEYLVASGSLPPGLSLDPTTGVLSGNPTTVGSSTFSIIAHNGFSADATTPSITISVVAGTPVGITPPATSPGSSPPGVSPAAPGRSGQGYWTVTAGGQVFHFGLASPFGSVGNVALAKPVVGMASTPDREGYWLVAGDGGIFTYGDAGFYGSVGGIRLAQPVVGMAATPDGKGYWLVGADGGVFSYGDAGFFGSVGNIPLAKPVVGISATPDGKGYWLVASDGGIFAFGDAAFLGSTGGQTLNQPVAGMAATADGNGYWLVAADGGVFNYGDAGFFGSMGGTPLASPVVGMVPTSGHGYWLLASDGGVFALGDATYFGSATGPAQPIVGGA